MTLESSNSKLLQQIHGKDSERDVILVVEDDTVSKIILERTLPSLLPGYRVEFVNDGVEAIARISSELKGKVALIVSDIEMQPVGGLEMIKNLKRDNEDPEVVEDMKHVPVFVNSASDSCAEGLEELIDAGMVDSFKQKPLGIENIHSGIFTAICNMRAKVQNDLLLIL